ALALGLAVADAGADEAGPLPPGCSPAGCGLVVGPALVQPARPAPVTAAPASSRNSRRSIGICRRYPLLAVRRGPARAVRIGVPGEILFEAFPLGRDGRHGR